MKDELIIEPWQEEPEQEKDEMEQALPEPAPEPDPEEDSFLEKRVPSKAKQYIGAVLSGSILSRAEVRKLYPYLLFVALLMMLYIANIFRTQQLYRRHDRLTVEVKELRAKAMTLSAERMKATKQSVIVRELAAMGSDLKEPLTPPKVINR